MAVAVQQPTRKRRDIFDVLLGGLQAASAITNIQKAQAELEAIPEAKARLARQEERQFATQFQEVPAETPGAVSLQPPGREERAAFLPRGQMAAGAQRRLQRGTETFKQLGEVRKNLTSNKDFQKAASKVLDSTTLVKLAEQARQNNQPAFEQMKVIIARMNQGGVLTDQDLATLGGSQQFLDVFDRFKATKVVGDVRPEDVDDLLAVAQAAREGGLETVQRIRGNTINTELKRFQASGIPMDRGTLEGVTEINDLLETALQKIPERKKAPSFPGARPRTPEEQESEFDRLLDKLNPFGE